MEPVREDAETRESPTSVDSNTAAVSAKSAIDSNTSTIADSNMDGAPLDLPEASVSLLSNTEAEESPAQPSEPGVSNAGFLNDAESATGTVKADQSGQDTVNVGTEGVVVATADSETQDSASVLPHSGLTAEDSALVQEAALLGNALILTEPQGRTV